MIDPIAAVTPSLWPDGTPQSHALPDVASEWPEVLVVTDHSVADVFAWLEDRHLDPASYTLMAIGFDQSEVVVLPSGS